MERVASSSLVRRMADAAFRRYARRRVTLLEWLCNATAQRDTLLRLVKRGSGTRFGRLHDFASIRSIEDYQERVPLRDYDAFWEEYWRPAFPRLHGATWSGRIPYVAVSSGDNNAKKYTPVSKAMLASNRRAALTSLAWFRAAHPNTSLFNGKLFFLGGSTVVSPLDSSRHVPLAGDMSGIVARELPALLRPYTFPALDRSVRSDWEQRLTQLAERSVRLPITLVSGAPSWLTALFERLRQITGRDCIADIWPSLRVVVHGGTQPDPECSQIPHVIGSDRVRFLETYPTSEGFIAAEDPRYGLLRLIPDHDIFFEFVPVGELRASNPARHTLENLVPGVQYAVVLTTCAGLWSYILGDAVCFEKVDPPLLRITGRVAESPLAALQEAANPQAARSDQCCTRRT
jgi:hypothetical protein